MKYVTGRDIIQARNQRSRNRKPVFKYQGTKKNGEWGAVITTRLDFYKTPEDYIKALNENNPGRKFRLVEA